MYRWYICSVVARYLFNTCSTLVQYLFDIINRTTGVDIQLFFVVNTDLNVLFPILAIPFIIQHSILNQWQRPIKAF